MALPQMSINPREAAVAATLAGAVVVVLGYASGLGLRSPVVNAAVVRPPVVMPTPPIVTPLVPPAAVILPPAVVIMPSQPAPTSPVRPLPTLTPTPTVEPTPSPTPPTCDPGLLGGLLAPVDSLVGGLLGGGLLGGGLLGSSAGATEPGGGLLACTVGSLLGPSCCDSVAGRTSKESLR